MRPVPALAGRSFADLSESLAAPAGLTAEERFRHVCRRYRAFALEHPDRYALIFSIGSPVTLTRDATAAAQIVWNALHGAVTIERADIGRTESLSATYEEMITLLLRGPTEPD